jgi:GT2 family glycosyltransferase
MSLPPASLIVATRDRPSLLEALVESVLAGDEVPAEIVIVDQSRTPHPRLSVAEAPVHYLWSRSVGLSRGRNAGIAAARHDLLVFTDDDLLVAPDWFGTLVRALVGAGPRAVVTGQVRPTEPETPGGFAPSTIVQERPAVYAGRRHFGALFPNNMAMRRSAFEEVGLFDERLGVGSTYPSSEDNDLSFRLLEAGYRIVYVPEAVVHHRAWRGRADYLPLRWRYGQGRGAYYAKHLRLRDPFMLGCLGRDTLGHALHAARLGRRPHLAAAEVVFVAGLLAGAIQWVLTEKALRRA